MSKPWRIFTSLSEPNWQLSGNKLSVDWGKAPEKAGFAAYFIHRIKRHWLWIKEVGESNVGRSLGLGKKQKEETHILLSHWWVQDSGHLLHMEMACWESRNNEGFFSSPAPVLVVLPSRGRDRKSLWHFKGIWISIHKNKAQSSVKAKIDLC